MSDQNVNQLRVKSQDEFLGYLKSLSKISESAIVTVDREKISSLITDETGTLILHAELDLDSGFFSTLNVPDVRKLASVIETVRTEDELKITVNSNNLEYRGNGMKFKYHLFDEGFLTKPSLNLGKINEFKFDVVFGLDQKQLSMIAKGSTFADQTNKLYLYTEAAEDGSGNVLRAELTDKSRHNTDNFTLGLGTVDFDLEAVPINYDNIRLLTCLGGMFKVSVNKEYGVVTFETRSDDTRLKYIISSLTQ